MIVKQITFEQIKNYWIDVNHFKDPNKKIVEVISTLGPHKTPYADPKRIAYGLFDADRLIGVTQLVQWKQNTVRYRTLNILAEFRGRDLGWFLILSAWNMHWQDNDMLVGWIRNTHYQWAKTHNFHQIDQQWTDDHILMGRWM